MREKEMKQKSERKREKMKEKNWGKIFDKKIREIWTMIVVFCLCISNEVDAEELSSAASLAIAGTRMVYSGEVIQSVVNDGNGGTAVYDLKNNTLTLTNFDALCSTTVIPINYMGENFTIILKGVNSLETTYTTAIQVKNGNLCIRGEGVLNANQGITGIANVKIQDCTLNINSEYYGVGGEQIDLEVDNAVINMKITDRGNLSHLSCGFSVRKLKITNSNIYASVPSAGTPVLVGEYAPRAIFVSEAGGIDLSSDLTVTNEKGQKLYRQVYYGGTAVGNNYIYTTEKTWDINDDNNIYKISDTVRITSATKTKQIEDEKKIKEVIALISQIGNVSGSSEAKIKAARDAYDSLSDEQKKKITNYQVLKNAESVYGKIKKTEQAQKSKVSIKKLKSTKKKTMTLTWKRDKACNGYQIAYSTKKNFKSKKLKTISKNKTVKYTFKKLKSKKIYYVKIRPYTKIDGKKVYGAWSKVKKVKVK